MQFPWDAKTDAAGAKGAEAAAGETELEDEAVSGVLALIGDAPVSRGKIASLLFPALKKDGKDVKTINAIIKIANSEDFLKAKAEEGMWKYAKQTVSSG